MRQLRASLARAKHVVERVQADRPGLRWEPNGVMEPELDVACTTARLHLGPHPDDADRRGVLLAFEDVRHVSFGFPNDEGRFHHRLWRFGLSEVHWIGKVEGSQLIEEVTHASALPSALTHWVVLLKEETVEVVARGLEVTRE